MDIYPNYTITYGSSVKDGVATTDPIILPTQGKFMVHDLQIDIPPVDIGGLMPSLVDPITVTPDTVPIDIRYQDYPGYGGLSEVHVNATPLEAGSTTINGTFTPASGNLGFSSFEVNVPINNQDIDVTQTSQTYTYTADSGYTGIGSITVTAQTASPAFTEGDAYADASFSHTETNVTTTDTDTGIYIQPDVSVNYSRASVLYSGAVNGWVNKANNAVAMEAETYMPEMGIYEPIYISGVTVPSGTTFNVTNNGTTNINGGLADKGVQVKANKEVVVDNMTNFPVTYATTTVVNGITYSAGDLKVPVYSPTSTSIQFPSGFATATTTSTVTLSGNITTINGLTIKDPLAVTGSGTAPGTNYFYMPKISSTRVLSNGPKVTIDSSTPTGGSNGDIWFQKMV